MQTMLAWTAHAREVVSTRRLVNTRHLLVAACAAWLLVAGTALAQEPSSAPPPDPVAAADDHGAEAHPADGHGEASSGEGAHGGSEPHGESVWVTLARLANFALLAGGLFYFLRAPVAAHLESRAQQIRGDLAMAAQVRADATQRLAEIEQRLKELPADLEQVQQRGVEEVAAEELRIAQQVEVERERVLAQARRDIDQRTRTARQALTDHAASLVVGVAEARLRETLTDIDQRRLADAFSSQVGSER